MQCLPGWYANGACGSGSREDCRGSSAGGKHHTMLHCCPHKFKNDYEHDCSSYSGNWGDNIFCPASTIYDNAKPTDEYPNNYYLQELTGLCASADRGRCGSDNNKAFEIKCCETKDVKVGPLNQCAWRYGPYGDKLVCPDDYAIAGYCGSPRQPECNKRVSYTGIQCCPIENMRS